jgi:hypothetical protein
LSCVSKYFKTNQRRDPVSCIIPVVPFIHVVLKSVTGNK